VLTGSFVGVIKAGANSGCFGIQGTIAIVVGGGDVVARLASLFSFCSLAFILFVAGMICDVVFVEVCVCR